MKNTLLRLVLAFSTLWLLGTSAMAQVVNGDFETGVLAPFTAIETSAYARVDTVAPHGGTYHFRSYENNGDGDLSQPLSTIPGATYTVSAWVRSSDLAGAPNNAARLALGTNPPVTCPALTDVYALCTANFVAQTTNDALHVYYKTVGGSGTVFVDDIQISLTQAPAVVQPVPTLSTGLLILLSLLLLTGAAWRKRQFR